MYAEITQSSPFEYHVLLSSSKPQNIVSTPTHAFEYHVISSSSKTRATSGQSWDWFENPVISSASKPSPAMFSRATWFENPVISSSSKHSKCWGFGINLCSLWAQVYLLLRPGVCDSSFQFEPFGYPFWESCNFFSLIWMACNFTFFQPKVAT